MARWTWEDRLKILINYANGGSIAGEGRRIGVSQSRACGLMLEAFTRISALHPEIGYLETRSDIRKHRDLIASYATRPEPARDGTDFPANLSTMTHNALLGSGIRNRAQLVQAIENNELSILGGPTITYNLGKKGLEEIFKGLGIEPKAKQPRKASEQTIKNAIRTLTRHGYKVIQPDT
jgi:hypothetical protein